MTNFEAVNALVEQMAIHAGDNIIFRDGAVALQKVSRELKDCRNELCLRCECYKYNHQTQECDGCRWKM